MLTVAATVSNWRAPWLETIIPATPYETASSASSGIRIPLTMIGNFVILNRQISHIIKTHFVLCLVYEPNLPFKPFHVIPR